MTTDEKLEGGLPNRPDDWGQSPRYRSNLPQSHVTPVVMSSEVQTSHPVRWSRTVTYRLVSFLTYSAPDRSSYVESVQAAPFLDPSSPWDGSDWRTGVFARNDTAILRTPLGRVPKKCEAFQILDLWFTIPKN